MNPSTDDIEMWHLSRPTETNARQSLFFAENKAATVRTMVQAADEDIDNIFQGQNELYVYGKWEKGKLVIYGNAIKDDW